MSFSFLQCSLQISNFYFRPKLKTAIYLPIFNFFPWFLFYIRDFIWIITLTEKFEIWRKLSIWRYTVTSIYTSPKTHVLLFEQYFRLILINKRAVTTNFNNSWRKPCTNNIWSAVLSFFPSVFAQVLTHQATCSETHIVLFRWLSAYKFKLSSPLALSKGAY